MTVAGRGRAFCSTWYRLVKNGLTANTSEPFGRISAQLAKQIIIQKIKEAEREKIYL